MTRLTETGNKHSIIQAMSEPEKVFVRSMNLHDPQPWYDLDGNEVGFYDPREPGNLH